MVNRPGQRARRWVRRALDRLEQEGSGKPVITLNLAALARSLPRCSEERSLSALDWSLAPRPKFVMAWRSRTRCRAC